MKHGAHGSTCWQKPTYALVYFVSCLKLVVVRDMRRTGCAEPLREIDIIGNTYWRLFLFGIFEFYGEVLGGLDSGIQI